MERDAGLGQAVPQPQRAQVRTAVTRRPCSCDDSLRSPPQEHGVRKVSDL